MREQTGSVANREIRTGPARARRSAAFAHETFVATNPGVTEIIAYAPRANANAPLGGWAKRAFDISVSASALLFLLPLLLLIAAAVRLDSPGQAIFLQQRGGFRGRPFRIWKFRTMHVMEHSGIVQATHDDARITELGAFLRRSSLDELPQLLNVLMGDMSIVGPRPHAIEHDAQFQTVDNRYNGRFRARPGVTGLAQVRGCRGPTETADKICARTGYDIDYVQNWSWKRDVAILFRTVSLLWKGDPGAL